MTKTSRQKIDNVIDFVLVFLLLNLRYLTPFFSSVARRFMNVTCMFNLRLVSRGTHPGSIKYM